MRFNVRNWNIAMPKYLPARLNSIGLAVLFAGSLFLAAPAQAAKKPVAQHASASGIAWLAGKSEAAVDDAFAKARIAAKPVLLYWGAAWCPPCNQLKATLFARQDFIALTRALVPVYLDGDLPGAQKLGSRFRVVGYPTLILFSPQGTEITRLPGESDAQRITESLQANLSGGREAKAVLADAQAGRMLSASDWNLLAFYSWETDEAQLVTLEQRAALLRDLAQRSQATNAEASNRLWLKSLLAGDAESNSKLPESTSEQREKLLGLLRNPDATRMLADILSEGAKTIVRSLHAVADKDRADLIGAYDAALARLQTDPHLSRADQTGAMIARVNLARIDTADAAVNFSLPEPLRSEVKALAQRMDAEITNGYERQAVITSAGYLLGQAGLWPESDALLRANLKKSHSPYYLMSQLGSNARKLGRPAEALTWLERAYQASQGPATRLQWGGNYAMALLDLAPQESARIEKVVAALFDEAAKYSDAYYGRSGRSLKRVVGKLAAWRSNSEQDAVLARLRERQDTHCRKIAKNDPRSELCSAVWPAG